MNKAEKYGRKTIILVYILGLLGMVGIILAINITGNHAGYIMHSGDYINISNRWTLDEAGMEPADLSRLGEYMNEETGILSIYYRLPRMDSDESLVYRSKDVYTKLLIGSEILYETDVPQSDLYNRSPGNLWNDVTIKSQYSEALVELQIFMVYDTDAITVDSTMWGDKADIVLGLFSKKVLGISVSVLMLAIGIVLIILDFLPTYRRAKKHHGMIWLGIYAMLMGLWSLIETNVMQFLVDDVRILQLIDNMVMIADNMPLLIYLDCEYGIFKNRFMRIFGYADSAFILISVIVQLSGVSDLHYMLPGAVLALMVFSVALFIWVIHKLMSMRKDDSPIAGCALQLSGICALWLFGFCESLRLTHADQMDRAEFIRIGMLIFVICFAISSQIETYKIIENGLKFDIISNLAYSDGLTGLGNRTAYLEQLEQYAGGEEGISQLGIVFLDVNNLKKVNDNQGHDKGDELITIAARIISDSFGRFGKAYRIGGDEFCVLMTGGSLQVNYERALEDFKILVDEANKAKWYTYEIQIANGFAICNEISKKNIDETIMMADDAMYINKNLLKRG